MLASVYGNHAVTTDVCCADIDIYDLADSIVLASASEVPGHEVLYIAAADNIGVSGVPEYCSTRNHYLRVPPRCACDVHGCL